MLRTHSESAPNPSRLLGVLGERVRGFCSHGSRSRRRGLEPGRRCPSADREHQTKELGVGKATPVEQTRVVDAGGAREAPELDRVRFERHSLRSSKAGVS